MPTDPAPAARFSDRVADYVKARPTYPRAVTDVLRDATGLRDGWVVADVGCGTGISARLLLDAGCHVVGVEPNDAMRAAADAALAGERRWRSVAAPAEATTLGGASVDLVVAAQAFHWFDGSAARREFRRILRGARPVALIWNDRKAGGTPFLDGYESLLETFGTDYSTVNHRNVGDGGVAAFFTPAAFTKTVLPNAQQLDLAGLLARLASSSYMPAPGHPRHAAMVDAAKALFDRTNTDGIVEILYETQVYVGRLSG